MSPIFPIINLILAIPLFAATLKVYQNYKKTGNELVGALYKVILCFVFRLLLSGFGVLFSQNLVFISSMELFSHFFLYIAMAYSLTIHFNFFFSREVPKFLFWSIVFWGIGMTTYKLLYLEPAIPYFYSNFVYHMFPRSETFILRLSRIFVLFYSILVIYVYISGSLKMTEKKTKIRAALIGSAGLLFVSGGVMRKLLLFLSIDYFWISSLSIVLNITILILYIIAIFVIKPPERPKYVKKVY